MNEHLRPLERFKVDLEKADFQYDAAQVIAVKKLDNLYGRLIARQAQVPGLRARVGHWLSVLMGRRRKIMPEQGLYFWGGVGNSMDSEAYKRRFSNFDTGAACCEI